MITFNAWEIFNADETGLFYKYLFEKTLTFKGDKFHQGKWSKECNYNILGVLCTSKLKRIITLKINFVITYIG